VRGAAALALGDPGTDRVRQKEFRDLILGSTVRYLNAYPSFDGRRSIPVPLSLQRNENEATDDGGSVEVVDLAAFDGTTGEANQSLKPLGYGFLTLGAARPALLQPKISARFHHQRDREKGRAWKDQDEVTHGAVFTLESLDAGQAFQGLIQVRAETEDQLDQIESRVKSLLKGPILVGRSRRGGYGGKGVIKWEDSRDREVQGVGREGLRPVTSDIKEGDWFRLLLASACIARDGNTGQIDPKGLPELIQSCLGGRAKVMRARWSFEPVGGFNRKWKLELPQVLGVSAGSVFLLEVRQDIPLRDLLAIEHEGLGERREEGYGRVVFLDKPVTPIRLHVSIEKPGTSLNGSRVPELVSEIEARIIWAQAVKKVEERAARIAESFGDKLPSNSLIGRLRTPLRGAPEEAIKTLKRLLSAPSDAERLKRPAMEQLEQCRGRNGQNLAEWILEATQQDRVLSEIKLDVLAQRFHIVRKESARQALNERSHELSVQLIDAVLATLAIRNKTKEAGDER